MTGTNNSPSPCTCERPNWRYGGRHDGPHDRCEQPFKIVCVNCSGWIISRCGRSSRNRCEPCSVTYRRRVRRIFLSGWSDNPDHRLFLLTLTAPGDHQHRLPNGEVCPCTPEGGIDIGAWNASACKGFNVFMTYLRRSYGPVQYCKAAEVQQRGALHFHVILRAEGGPDTRRLWALCAWDVERYRRRSEGPGRLGRPSRFAPLCLAGSTSS